MLRFVLCLSLALLAGCVLQRAPQRAAIELAERARPQALSCTPVDKCAIDSPFAALTDAKEVNFHPPHHLGLVEHGDDALALRLHLIRSARASVDLQTFIFADDVSGRLILRELLQAARRGVRVRVLSDQLFSLGNTDLLAALAVAHANFEFKLYNPAFGHARTEPIEFAAGLLCCFTRFNHRMHTKLLLVDSAVGVTGGRNADDRYFDLSPTFNYRDRDVWITGPATATMRASFEAYWQHDSAVPVAGLGDVAAKLRRRPDTVAWLDQHLAVEDARGRSVAARAEDADWIRREFIDRAFAVERVEYFADLPNKPFRGRAHANNDLTQRIGGLIAGATRSVVLETPYLILSKLAREAFAALRAEHPAIRLQVATNSLAATDAFYVYAISYKYKRLYLKRLKFEIHEFKPFDPKVMAEASAPSGAVQRTRLRKGAPAPLVRPGVRRGLHAKGIVIDGEIALVGSHNFDPRSDQVNTETGLIVWDRAFAQALQSSIEADLTPAQAWTIARRPRRDVVSRIGLGIARLSEELPLFDLWPFRYATSYEIKAGCEPRAPGDAGFYSCYDAVGDFPEVNASLKAIYTRMVTAFGSGLEPIL